MSKHFESTHLLINVNIRIFLEQLFCQFRKHL